MFSFSAAVTEWLRRADLHRVAILCLILLKVGVEWVFGIPTNLAVIVLLAGWLLLAVAVWRLMRRVAAGEGTRRRSVILAMDLVLATAACHLVGGTTWLGASAYAIVLIMGAVSLPGRTFAALTALAIVAYGVPLFGETYGLLTPQPLAGTPTRVGTPQQALTTWTFGALTIGMLAGMLHTFVQLVRRGAEWHELLVEQAPVMIGTLDRAGRITAANPAAAGALAISVAELIGREVFDFLIPEGDQPPGRRLAAVMRGEAHHFETRIRRADGVERWANVMAHPFGEHGHVDGVLCLVHDVTESRAAAEALTWQAYHDTLTGLANRARLGERLAEALARATAMGDPSSVAVLMMDLDGFKTVNDSLGHGAGDELLVEVAARLLSATRGSDVVARLGGDEFAVVLEKVVEDRDVIAVADRILQALRAPYHIAGHQLFVGASLGFARGDHAPADAAASPIVGPTLAAGEPAAADERPGTEAGAALLRDADSAMYRAKAHGKGRWARFEPAMHAAAVDRLALAADLQQAIQREQMVLAYQPIVELATGRVTGVEALVRWRHPARGLVLPAEFIPLAEETGLIVQLGRWVLDEACRQAAAWRALPAHASLGIAVNVSGRQLERTDFLADVGAALARNELPAAALTLEFTEHAVVERPELVRRRLEALQNIGVRVAIDDFGTGYAAVDELQRFPVDVLKIDRTFVGRIERGGAPAAVARALVTIGEALALEVVAEGIETEEQRAQLLRLGAGLGQGNLFARPLPASDLSLWLATQPVDGPLPDAEMVLPALVG